MSVSSFDEMHRRLKESLQRRNSKMTNYIQRVEMLAVAIRQVMFVFPLKKEFGD
jgi:hypothetical protein